MGDPDEHAQPVPDRPHDVVPAVVDDGDRRLAHPLNHRPHGNDA
jgi:hypothetical protein